MQLKKNLFSFLVLNFLTSASYGQDNTFLENANQDQFLAYEQSQPVKAWLNPYRLTFSHTEGKFLDNARGYTSIGLFSALPFSRNSFITFTDIRGHFFNDYGRKAANVGLGLRYQRDENAWIYGINTYYDYREASYHHDYHQASLGFELLGENIDFRLNTYLPVGYAEAHSRKETFTYTGGYFATFQNVQKAQGGFDGEVGYWFQKESATRSLNLYGAIGGYYYAAKKHFRNDYGFKAKVEARFMNYFTFELKGGYDDIYHGMGQGTLAVAIPLDALFGGLDNILTRVESKLYQPVKRQEIIFLSRKECHWVWNFPSATIPCCR